MHGVEMDQVRHKGKPAGTVNKSTLVFHEWRDGPHAKRMAKIDDDFYTLTIRLNEIHHAQEIYSRKQASMHRSMQKLMNMFLIVILLMALSPLLTFFILR